MPFLSRGRAESVYRVFFATDVHGSDRCFAKFLAAAKVYQADALILGGDLAGKGIVPIIELGQGKYRVRFQGAVRELVADELEAQRRIIRFNGLYPLVMDEASVRELEDPAKLNAAFAAAITDQIRRWCTLAAERLPESVRCVITPGNDDPYVIDDTLRAADRVECPEKQVVQVGSFWLASFGTTNRTPWDSEREADEADLKREIDSVLHGLPDGRALWFNFHAPPRGCGLDTAVKLDADLRPVVERGMVLTEPVGSIAVRDAILQYRPLVGLHGHIHEAGGTCKLGSTLCINPGSDYSSGVLKGVIVQVDSAGRPTAHLLTNG